MVYVNEKPILLVCDNMVFAKILDCISEKMKDAETGFPYDRAKEHYILDIDNSVFSKEVIASLEPVILIPKPKKTFINPVVILGANGMSSKLSMTRDAYKTLRIWNKKSTPDRVLFLFHIPSKL